MTSGEGIRVGVVGAGAFGRYHVRHYARHPGAVLVAIADADQARADSHAGETGAEAFADHRDLIGKVDAVSVAVPAIHHHAVAADFLDAGVHVLIEKPIAIDSASAEDLVARAERAGVILQVGHIERYSPAVSELAKRLVDPRRIAAVRKTGWSGRSADVDVILDLMIHDIDLVLTLAGAPVVSVAANGATTVSTLTDEAEAWLTFANGITATLSASRSASENQRQLTVTEPGTVYVADLAGPTLVIRARAGHAAAETVSLTPHDNLGAQIAAFIDSVANGTRPLVDGRAGAQALAIAERIQAAIADGPAPDRRSK